MAILFAASADAVEPDLKYSVSWVGNTFSGKSQWVLQDVADIFVDPDGTLFTNVVWDEAGGNVQAYRDGKLLAVALHTHGWGYEGGEAVAADAKYVFIAQSVSNEGGGLKGDSWPAKGLAWSGISRRSKADIRIGVPFVGGHGKEGDVLHGAFLPIAEMPNRAEKSGAIRGLCATGSRLYVSSPFDHSIKVFDTESMQPVASWSVDRPDRVRVDNAQNVWVLQRPAADGESWKALRFSADGKPLPQTIEFEKEVNPTSFCFDGSNRLLIADAGPAQQIRIYDDLDKRPKLAGTLGTRGGIFAGPVAGQFGDLRFNKPTAVGTDAKGNIYVASSGSVSGGSTVIESYSPATKLNWRVMGLTFVDLADFDAVSDVDVFSKEEHFTLDHSQPPGLDWTYKGYTVNPLKYPDDPRLHLSPTNAVIRQINGHKFLFVTDMTGEYLHVYRFSAATDGETAIPCALFSKRHIDRPDHYPPNQPARGEWLWLDRNGNGAMDAGEFQNNDGRDGEAMLTPDDRGSLWNVIGDKIRCLAIKGLDEHGTPMWDFAKAKTWPVPPEFDQVRRVHYLADSDTMLLGGNKAADHNQHWKPMGPVLCCYDHWSGEKPAVRWKTLLPYEAGSHGHESAEPISFDVAGDYVFVAYTRGLKADSLKWAFVKVLRLKDGSFVGNLNCESELGEIGLLDLVQSVRAVKRGNGQFIVFLEDDEKSKIVMFRWQP